ncbi:MAG TPA: hypothetical protein VKB80_33115 [Kofleriaceae bacterium]|nr:hypothetical protein [Kofleriaceae bacterium]
MRASILAITILPVLAAAPACGGEGESDPSCAEEPCLAPPESGLQLTSTRRTIDPGEDRELCEAVRLPGGPDQEYDVNHFELAMTRGSHHLIVAAIQPGSETEAGVRDRDVVDCVGPTGFGEDIDIVTGAQLPYYDEAYPDGVGKVYRGGQYLVLDYHYFNATDVPIDARVAINLHTTGAASIEKVMSLLAFANLDIETPAGETRSFPTDCRADDDVMVYKLMRHTHRWGTDFPVEYAGGARDGELIYTSASYEDPDFIFEEPVRVAAGEGFRFTCSYDNTTSEALRFGVKATDEMCILFGLVFSPTGREVPNQICVVGGD